MAWKHFEYRNGARALRCGWGTLDECNECSRAGARPRPVRSPVSPAPPAAPAAGHTEVRRHRRLVISFIATIANYE